MKTTFVSTLASSAATRQSVMSLQSQLTIDQNELASGKVNDLGLSLGNETGRTFDLTQQQSLLQTTLDINGQISTRLSAVQNAADAVQASAQNFLKTLISAQGGAISQSLVQSQAQGNLQDLISNLNTSVAGQYVFAGDNTGTAPIANYFANPPPASKQAVDAAFSAAFGTTQTGAGVQSITPAAMTSFLQNQFAALFLGTNWSTTWSSATNGPIENQIAPGETIDTSVSANQPAAQTLAMAYTMVADLGTANLNSQTFQAVISQATQLIGQATQQLTQTQANIGGTQASITNANSNMMVQMNILSSQVNQMEQVNPYDLSTQITQLQTQLETSYSLTARLQNLSLVTYLPAGS
jgi:flagellar hook-associated protein 3 FlgL